MKKSPAKRKPAKKAAPKAAPTRSERLSAELQDQHALAAALMVGTDEVATTERIAQLTLFANRAMKDANLLAAAEEAGIELKGNMGNKRKAVIALLNNPVVQGLIRDQQQAIVRKVQITPERIWAELGRIAFLDPRQLFKDGEPIPVDEMDEDVARAISGYKSVRKKFGEDGESEEKELKFGDKMGALRDLQKLLGMVKDDRPVIDADAFLAALYEGRQRAAQR